VQRGARIARTSPDGQWLASIGERGRRHSNRGAGRSWVFALSLPISSTSRVSRGRRTAVCVVVHAHPKSSARVDWWVVAGSTADPRPNTGVLRTLRHPIMFCRSDRNGLASMTPSCFRRRRRKELISTNSACYRGFSRRFSQQLTASNEFRQDARGRRPARSPSAARARTRICGRSPSIRRAEIARVHCSA